MKRMLSIMSALGMTSAAAAFVMGGSNFGFSGYPKADCLKPGLKPTVLYTFNNQAEIDLYNSQVKIYNSQALIYAQCINMYLENATLDIKRIQESAKEAANDLHSL